jgi:hypothetical protein
MPYSDLIDLSHRIDGNQPSLFPTPQTVIAQSSRDEFLTTFKGAIKKAEKSGDLETQIAMYDRLKALASGDLPRGVLARHAEIRRGLSSRQQAQQQALVRAIRSSEINELQAGIAAPPPQ